MNPVFEMSIFRKVYFPESREQENQADLVLRRLRRFAPAMASSFLEHDLVVFDFETTGLDSNQDEIIEIGAIKYRGWKEVGRFESLIKPSGEISRRITEITGLTDEDLKGAPSIGDVLPKFLDFFESSLILAHNADFDLSFLSKAAMRLGHELDYPCYCSLKMARQLVPNLESKNLDTLAEFFGLGFEARHRSIGDVKVTAEVARSLLESEGQHLKVLQDFCDYRSFEKKR